MKVELLTYTGKPNLSAALDLLLTTKGTRLAHNEDPATWDAEKRAEHLAYMRDTIKSSWEFVDYVFRISGVTRAFTHQLVRTRPDSYAQEAMRVKNAKGFEQMMPSSIKEGTPQEAVWLETMQHIEDGYTELVDLDVPLQDARGVLPTNVLTAIIVKKNLRSMANTAELRLCTRTQGEYQDVFREMKRLVCEVHPWADPFIRVYCANHTHCAFPRYGEKDCPVYPAVIPNEAVEIRRAMIQAKWETVRFEANPVAAGGKAM